MKNQGSLGGVKKFFLIIAGSLALGFGVVGAFVPVLPTTPFVLLSAGLFAGGSPRMNRWLRRSRFFGSYIENYRSGAGVPVSIKRSSILFLWGGLLFSMYLVKNWWVTVLLLLVGAGVTVHICMLKSK